ncbi:MAG: hypothetical protein PHC97_04100, partial [Patescibacteria group bacterium]|nr:hypothetical protein [Patescibacteria group bacterium]
GDCVPGSGGTDTIIRDDVGAGLLTTGVFPYTYFNAAGFLVYADKNASNSYTFGATAATTESLWLENQGDATWDSVTKNILVEADGTATTGVGVDDDAPLRGDILIYLQAGDNVCAGFDYVAAVFHFEDIYVDGNGNCIPGDGGADSILFDLTGDGLTAGTVYSGTWASMAGTLAFSDAMATGVYTFGASAAATDSLWTTFWVPGVVHNPTYTSTGDTKVFGFDHNLKSGDDLVSLKTAVGVGGQPIIYADADFGGSLNSTDEILEDTGNVQGGPATVPNGVIDRQGDVADFFTFKNIGTASSDEITNVRLYGDFWFTGSNGRCDTPAGSVDDLLIGTFTYDVATQQWVSSALNSIVFPALFRACIVADISPTALSSHTLIPQIPQLHDVNSNGRYDAGDSGLFFFSANDGPTGGSINAPYSITFTNAPGSSSAASGGSSFTCGVNINNGNATTSDLNVNLSISASGLTASEMIISDNSSFTGASFEPFSATKNWTLSGGYGDKTVYLVLKDANGTTSQLCSASINYSQTGAPTPVPTQPSAPILHGSEPAAPLPSDVQAGELVKIAGINSVYFISSDNRRHAFPNEMVFFSWFKDFSNVKTISSSTLALIPLGSDVTIRPGTWLLKVQSDPKVYAVEAYGVLRWVKTETVAQNLYGADWNKKILDINPSFMFDYQFGSDIETSIHPTGSVIQYADSSVKYYVENGQKRLISPAVFSADLFQDKFVLKNISTSITYTSGSDLTASPIQDLISLR